MKQLESPNLLVCSFVVWLWFNWFKLEQRMVMVSTLLSSKKVLGLRPGDLGFFHVLPMWSENLLCVWCERTVTLFHRYRWLERNAFSSVCRHRLAPPVLWLAPLLRGKLGPWFPHWEQAVGFLWILQFPSQSKDMYIRWTKFPIGASLCGCSYTCLATDWRPVHGLPTVLCQLWLAP